LFPWVDFGKRKKKKSRLSVDSTYRQSLYFWTETETFEILFQYKTLLSLKRVLWMKKRGNECFKYRQSP
jgi:hypothetical protein